MPWQQCQLAGHLNYMTVRRAAGVDVGKEAPMWIYDGEQWTEEGGSAKANKTEQTQQLRIEDMFLPELQVEIHRVPRTNPVPPFPMP